MKTIGEIRERLIKEGTRASDLHLVIELHRTVAGPAMRYESSYWSQRMILREQYWSVYPELCVLLVHGRCPKIFFFC